MASFAVGDSFSSYDELMRKITQFETENYVAIWKRDSRSVEAAAKTLTKTINHELRYYNVTFACQHGGKKFKSRSHGERATQ